MPTGRIIKLVHLSPQMFQPTSRLIPSHNDKGYGTIRDVNGRDVYLSHHAVPGGRRFDDSRRGQSIEFTLESGSHSSAKFVAASTTPADGHGPTVKNAGIVGIHFRHIGRTFRRPFQPPSNTYHPCERCPPRWIMRQVRPLSISTYPPHVSRCRPPR
jgi:cold shock CspA family protein